MDVRLPAGGQVSESPEDPLEVKGEGRRQKAEGRATR
jgi:hypothetical protein